MLALQGIKVAADQAGGKLFDLGPDNQKAADANCRIHLGKVEKGKAKAEGAPAIEWGAECTKYIAEYDEACLAKLGAPEHGETCKKNFIAVMAPLKGDDLERAEFGCGMARQMK
jgi:hypothetical protein